MAKIPHILRLLIFVGPLASPLKPQPLPTGAKLEQLRKDVPDLKFVVSAAKTAYPRGEPIEIITHLSYSGTADLRIGMPGSVSSPLSKWWYYNIDVRTPFPTWIPLAPRATFTDRGKTVLRDGTDSWGKVRRMRPELEYRETFDLSQVYSINEPGAYKVSVSRWVYINDGPGWAIVTTNEIVITVLPD